MADQTHTTATPKSRRRGFLSGLLAASAATAVTTVPAVAATVSPPLPAEAAELLAIGERLPDVVARIQAARTRYEEAKAAFERLRPSVPPEIIAPEGESQNLTEMERELNNQPTPYDEARRGFRDFYSSRKLKAHIILYDISGRTKEGRRLRRIVRLAKRFEKDRESAISASGYHEAFGALLGLHIELQDDFAAAALAIKPLTMQGLGIYAAIIATGNGPASYDGRPVGGCDQLGRVMAECFIAMTTDGPSLEGRRA